MEFPSALKKSPTEPAKTGFAGRQNAARIRPTRILFLSTRTDPRQEVELEASREPDSKITQIEISSPLPKPDTGSE